MGMLLKYTLMVIISGPRNLSAHECTFHRCSICADTFAQGSYVLMLYERPYILGNVTVKTSRFARACGKLQRSKRTQAKKAERCDARIKFGVQQRQHLAKPKQQ